MTNIESFRETITNGYTFKGDAITLGGAVYEGQPIENALVKLPLKSAIKLNLAPAMCIVSL